MTKELRNELRKLVYVLPSISAQAILFEVLNDLDEAEGLLQAAEAREKHLAAMMVGLDICPTKEHWEKCLDEDVEVFDEKGDRIESVCIECLCRFAAEQTKGGAE
jgi:hypothetical protein